MSETLITNSFKCAAIGTMLRNLNANCARLA